jgi:hypothetical protein
MACHCVQPAAAEAHQHEVHRELGVLGIALIVFLDFEFPIAQRTGSWTAIGGRLSETKWLCRC